MPARLVGRHDEVARLEAALDRAAEGGTHAIMMFGEAGVGKTRCLDEFAQAAMRRGAMVLIGRCPAMAVGVLPYAAVADALRFLAAGRREWFTGWLDSASVQLRRLVPDLAGAADGDTPAPPAAGSLFGELVGLLDRAGAGQPVVLGIEDVQWCDRSTRDLLGLLIRGTPSGGLLVVLTCRSDELAYDDPLLSWLSEVQRTPTCQRIDLGRLDRAETTQLLAGLLPVEAPPDLVERIIARTDGNPFFVEELAAAYCSGSPELPPTVRDLALVRFAVLPRKGPEPRPGRRDHRNSQPGRRSRPAERRRRSAGGRLICPCPRRRRQACPDGGHRRVRLPSRPGPGGDRGEHDASRAGTVACRRRRSLASGRGRLGRPRPPGPGGASLVARQDAAARDRGRDHCGSCRRGRVCAP